MDFATFYAQGGLFMHVISLLGVASAVMLARRTWRLRPGSRARRGVEQVVASDPMLVATMTSMVLVGALGTAFGLMEVAAALRTVPPEQFHLAASRGGQIAITTVAWGLLTVVSLVLTRGAVGQLERRAARLEPARAQS